jgi:mercuric ion binding protein
MRNCFISLFVALVVSAYPLTALAEVTVVIVRVDGLSCPFCAYGLEKKIKKMEGVEKMEIDLEGGKVEIRFGDREDVQVEEIEEAVKDAGFTPKSIKVEKVGQ